MRLPTPNDPPWEQFLRSIIGEPRVSEKMRHDFFLCFEEIDQLRKAVEESAAEIIRLKEELKKASG